MKIDATEFMAEMKRLEAIAESRPGSPILTYVCAGFYLWADADGAVWDISHVPDEDNGGWIGWIASAHFGHDYTDPFETLYELRKGLGVI